MKIQLHIVVAVLLASMLAGCTYDQQQSGDLLTVNNPVIIGADVLFLPQSLIPPLNQVLDEYEGYPLGADLPHHLPFAQAMFYEFYQGLQKKRPDIETFVILGPDHYEAGQGISTLRDGFETPLGLVNIDQSLLDVILQSDEVSLERELFTNEHAVFVHLLYIKHFFPEAQVVPLAFRSDVVMTDVQKLAIGLAPELQDTFIVCSTDLSHYKPSIQSNTEDDQTIEMLVNMDISSAEDVNIDSPAAATALLALMKEWKVAGGTLLGRANSADLGGDPASTTGYAVVVYTR